MKTIVIISTPFGLENNIPEIKDRIVKYLGGRLIKENPDNAPMLVLNEALDLADKEYISQMVDGILETAALVLVETNNEQFGKDGNMLVLNPV